MEALSFDDVLLVPQYSDINSRSELDIRTELFGLNLRPILSANMPSVTSTQLAIEMYRHGGLGVLHRFNTPDEAVEQFEIVFANVPVAVSLGVKDYQERAGKLWDAGANIFFIDVAHGDHKQVKDVLVWMKEVFPDAYVCVGNIVTLAAAQRLAAYGADALKIGVGPGAACITREVTGFGVPQVSALYEVAQIKQHYPNVKIIADGGIKNSGDIVKALYFGADAVMIGSLFAGTEEAPTPGLYYGNASEVINGHNAPEGVSGEVPNQGTVEQLMKRLTWGIKSGFSYAGARSAEELRLHATYVTVTGNSTRESGARVAEHR